MSVIACFYVARPCSSGSRAWHGNSGRYAVRKEFLSPQKSLIDAQEIVRFLAEDRIG